MEPSIIYTIEKFFSSYRLRRYPKGQVLILDGEDTGYVYYLIDGRVKAYDTSYRGAELILSIYGPYTFFPIAPLVSRTNRFIFEAETDIEVRQAPLGVMVQFLQDHPEVVYSLMGQLHGRVEDILSRMSHMMAGSAKKRLVYELVLECRYFGVRQANGTHHLLMSEREIGARAGLSRETVSREINKLKKENLVKVRPSNIIILDITELEKRLETIV
jgi:CRP-like cAMP-binding protein